MLISLKNHFSVESINMHFQALPVLATVLALPYLAFGEPTCYNSDVWKDEAARSEAAHAIDKWCNNLAPSTWEPRRERKQCLEVDYSPHNVNLWMNNGNLGDATIQSTSARSYSRRSWIPALGAVMITLKTAGNQSEFIGNTKIGG